MTSSGLRLYAGFELRGKGHDMTRAVDRNLADTWKIGYEEIDRRKPTDLTTGVLWIAVPFTTPDLTRSALRHAGVCTDLDVHVSLVDVQVVPFPCPLNQ